MDLESLYLDYNATSPLSESAKSWLESGEVLFANPSSQHSAGKASRKVINEVRSQLYCCFSLQEKSHHLFFHSGATEAISTFAHSFSEWARLSGRDLLVCYSKLDHPAVTELSQRYFGSHVKFLELTQDKNLEYEHAENLKKIQDKKDDNPNLLILYHHLWVHNETGIVSPLIELAQFKKIPDLYIHVDAVQTPGKILDWQKLVVGDIFSYSAHKFGALKSVGFSFFTSKIQFHPLISGGGQQNRFRSGTENSLLVKTLGLALADILKVDVVRTTKLRERFEEALEKDLVGIGEIISKRSRSRNSNTIYLKLNQYPSDISLALFDVNGLMLSAGSACSSGAAKDSVVLLHLGAKDTARNGLRISFNPAISESELVDLIERFHQVFEKIKKS